MTVENDLNVENKKEVIERYIDIYGEQRKTNFIHKYWGNRKMIMTYPNITIKLQDGSIVYVHDLLPQIKPYIYKF